MEAILGTTVGVFIGVTVAVMGGAAYMTGQALANTWRPLWQLVGYCALLSLGARFLIFALFEGELLSLSGVLIDAAVLIAIGLLSYRMRHVARTVQQYPWLYRRTSLWSYREKD